MRAGFEPKSLYTMSIDFTGEAGQLTPVVIYISVAVLTFLKISYCGPHSDEAQWILEMDACFCTLQNEIDDLYLIEMNWGLDWATWSEMKENSVGWWFSGGILNKDLMPTQLLTCINGYSSSSDYLFSYINLKEKGLKKKTALGNFRCNSYYIFE